MTKDDRRSVQTAPSALGPRLTASAVVLVLFALVIAGAVWLRRHNLPNQALRTGLSFPALHVTDRFNHVVDFDGRSQSGRHIVFYTKSTCGHCSAEMSDLQQAIFTPGSSRTLPAVVLVDPDGASQDDLHSFIQEIPTQLPVFVDRNGMLSHQYPATKVPTTIFLLNSGTISKVIVGERSGNYLLQQITAFSH